MKAPQNPDELSGRVAWWKISLLRKVIGTFEIAATYTGRDLFLTREAMTREHPLTEQHSHLPSQQVVRHYATRVDEEY